MTLDIVIPTYNRSALLRRTIVSLLRAPLPPGLDVRIVVVDNNSPDDTAQMVKQMRLTSERPLVYVLETAQGSSQARNAGIAAGQSELIGFVDDDEEVDEHWFEVIKREFQSESVSFIGGPYRPCGEVQMPSWLPPGYNGVIGVSEPKPRSRFEPSLPVNLNGGNAVLRRSVFAQVGLYDPRLGRSNKGLTSEEDAEHYRRLLKAGLEGIYVPDLVIYHYIPASRLTRRYHRRWCFWRGVSHGVADGSRKEPVRYFLGVPRYRFAQAVRGLLAAPRNLSPKGSGRAFAQELAVWDLLGFLRGKYFTRVRE